MSLQKKHAYSLEYILKKGRQKSKRAVFIFHGYGASMDDLAPLAHVLDPNEKWDWYFPNGILEVPIGFMMTGRAWFPIDITRFEQAMGQNQLEELFLSKVPDGLVQASDHAYTFINNISQDYEEIVVGGFSQGSMLSLELSFNTDISPKKLALLSTTMIGKEHMSKILDKPSSFPIFQSHGTQDPILPYSLAEKARDIFQEKNKTVEFHSFEGGHEIPPQVVQSLQNFLDTDL